jgi:hypothetical protein
MTTKADWALLETELRDALKAALTKILQGTDSDLHDYAQTMAANMVAALATGDDNLVDEIVAQGRTLAEAARLRTNNAGWDVIGAVIGVALKAGFVLLAGVESEDEEDEA